MAAEAQPSSLAHKLNRLFETIHPAGRGEYSPEEVARAISESGDGSISPAYIYMLRKGQRDNPTKRHLELLAGFLRRNPHLLLRRRGRQADRGGTRAPGRVPRRRDPSPGGVSQRTLPEKFGRDTAHDRCRQGDRRATRQPCRAAGGKPRRRTMTKH